MAFRMPLGSRIALNLRLLASLLVVDRRALSISPSPPARSRRHPLSSTWSVSSLCRKINSHFVSVSFALSASFSPSLRIAGRCGWLSSQTMRATATFSPLCRPTAGAKWYWGGYRVFAPAFVRQSEKKTAFAFTRLAVVRLPVMQKSRAHYRRLIFLVATYRGGGSFRWGKMRLPPPLSSASRKIKHLSFSYFAPSFLAVSQK